MRGLKVWASAAALIAAIVWTGWDWVTNRSEPFHVLMLSWLALDISLAQLLLAALTKRKIDEDGQS